jgi:hypothetical protein
MDEVVLLSSELICVGQIVAMVVRLMSLLLKLQSTEAAVSLIRSEILDVDLSKNSVLALNGVLLDPPVSILEQKVMRDILSLAVDAAWSADVHPYHNHSNTRTQSRNLESSLLARF